MSRNADNTEHIKFLEKRCIGIVKEHTNLKPFIVATHGHHMDLTPDGDSREDLQASISRAGRAMVGTEEEITAYAVEFLSVKPEHLLFINLCEVNQ